MSTQYHGVLCFASLFRLEFGVYPGTRVVRLWRKEFGVCLESDHGVIHSSGQGNFPLGPMTVVQQ